MSWDESVRVAVNVSAAQFRRENLEHQVHSVLRDSGLPPSGSSWKLPRRPDRDISRASQTLKSPQIAWRHDRARRFRHRLLVIVLSAGVSGSTGSRSTFLRGLARLQRASWRSFRAVIGLAHGFNVPVLAEGVETNEQLAILMRERCDDVQGYLIGRPPQGRAVWRVHEAGADGRLQTAS